MPLAEEVDPLERIPGVLAQLGLVEPPGVELAHDEVAVDRLVAAQVAGGDRLRTSTATGR